MSSTKARQYVSMAVLAVGGVVVAGILAGTLSASATDTPTPAPTATGEAPANPNAGDTSKPQRIDEALLPGATADKVKAAALAKYPGATFIRVESDSDGVYEAHINQADGSEISVEVDRSFAVTGAEQGGHSGHHGDHGDHDSDDDAESSST